MSSELVNAPLLAMRSASPARDRRTPSSGWAFVASVLIHGALLAAATQYVWQRLDPAPPPSTDFIWIGELPQPLPAVEVAPSVEPMVEPSSDPLVETVPPQAIVEVTPPPSTETQQRSEERAVEPVAPPVDDGATSELEAPAGTGPAPVRNPDWDEERRRAVASVTADFARANEFRAPTVEQLMRPRERERYVAPEVSIFDLPSRGSSGGGALTPGQARTRVGRAIAEFCNALTGGFGIFGFGVCARPDNRPTGLYPEVMPEWLKLMPVCDDAPVVTSAFPTARCRLVPKQTEEPLSGR